VDTFVLTEKESRMGKRPTYPPDLNWNDMISSVQLIAYDHGEKT